LLTSSCVWISFNVENSLSDVEKDVFNTFDFIYNLLHDRLVYLHYHYFYIYNLYF
jgi:hypothetical protein